MSEPEKKLDGPDFAQGVPLADIPEGGVILGHVAGEAAVLARRSHELFAIGAECTHYHGPLAEGVLVEDTLRCPWHHACFSLRTGEALRAPALNPVPCWRVELRNGTVYVREKVELTADGARPTRQSALGAIVIVGGGAAGEAAAEMLRHEGYSGPITMLSDDDAPPCDRPSLSKDYLAGNAPEEWVPLRPLEFYREQCIDLRLGARVTKLDTAGKRIVLDRGAALDFDAALLATGADAVHLAIPGADEHVHYLRTLADSRAIIERCKGAKRAVVLGASFIGLEAAASLRARGV